jgi:hypothetical protein
MTYIEDRVDRLGGRKELILDTVIGNGFEPRLLLNRSDIAGGIFNPQGNNNTPQNNITKTVTQDIKLDITINTQKIDESNIEPLTETIASSIARKLRTGRVLDLKDSIRGVV